MKKRHSILLKIIAVAVVAVIVVCACTTIVMICNKRPGRKAAENERFVLYDKRYYSKSDSVHFIRLTVVDKETGTSVFTFGTVRSRDYFGAEFIKDSNNIIVNSSDVGYIIYEYHNESNTWTER